MSGHSKWSTIKEKREQLMQKRAKAFSRIVKEIQVAVREGGSDPEANPRLRLAIQNSKGVNMPKENVERAISKASKGGENMEEVTYEGYAPHGVAIFIECMTDNVQRTVGHVRSIFNKRNGSLGTNGSLSFIFDRKGVFNVIKGSIDIEAFELDIIDAGVDDIEVEGDYIIITTPMEDFGNVQKKLDELGVEIENAQLQRIPNDTKKLSLEDSKKILRLVEEFEELDDVQNVYHNLELTEEIMASLDE